MGSGGFCEISQLVFFYSFWYYGTNAKGGDGYAETAGFDRACRSALPVLFSRSGQSPFSVIVSFFAPGESVRPNTNEKGEKI